MVAYSLGRNEGPAATRRIRRDHAGDGRDRRVGDLHEPERGRQACSHALSHSRRMGSGRSAGHAGGIHLGGTGDAAAGRGGTVPLSSGGISSRCGVRLWLGAAAGDPDRRDGRRGGDVRAILPGDQRRDLERQCNCGDGAARADRDQLLRGPRRKQCTERADADEDRRHRGHGGLGTGMGRRDDSSAAAIGRTGVAGVAGSAGRGHGSGGVRLRRMADRDVRGGRDAESGARPLARAGGGRYRRHPAVPGGERGVFKGTRARRDWRRPARRLRR